MQKREHCGAVEKEGKKETDQRYGEGVRRSERGNRRTRVRQEGSGELERKEEEEGRFQ